MKNILKTISRKFFCCIALYSYCGLQMLFAISSDYLDFPSFYPEISSAQQGFGREETTLVNWLFTKEGFVLEMVTVLSLIAFFIWMIYWKKYKKCKEKMRFMRSKIDQEGLYLALQTFSLSLIDDAVLITGPDNKIVEVNSAFQELFHIEGDIRGKLFSDVFMLIRKDTELNTNTLRKSALQHNGVEVLDEDVVLSTVREKRCYDVVGKIRLLCTSEGRDVGIVFRLGKAMKQNGQEKFFSVAMKKLNAYSWSYNCNTGEVLYGENFRTIGGGAEKINTITKYAEKVHPEDRERFLVFFKELSSQCIRDFSIIYRVDLLGDGNYHWSESRGVVESIKNNGTEERCFFCIDIDIDNQKQYEIKLSQALEKAKQSDKLKSSFLSNVSHEIRTPLNSIVGFSALLAQTDDIEERNKFVSVINANSSQLLQVVSDILSFSKIESGNIELSYSEFDLSTFLSSILSSRTSSLAESDQLELRENYPSQSYFIYSDKKYLEQAVVQLLNNAIKFTSDGFVELGYTVSESSVSIYVRDTGIGISKEDLGRIFDRFTKLDEFSSGVGLGLTIAHTIVERMFGTIHVESEVEKGSVFTIILPLK